MSEWRSMKTNPPKEGAVIVARDGVHAFLGRVMVNNSGGMFNGLVCLSGAWIHTGNSAKRALADFEKWKPAQEVINLDG